MQLEWSRFLNGIAVFKESQGMFWLLSAAVLVFGLKTGLYKKHRWLLTSLVLGVLVLFPVTAVVLLKGYTPFYNWNDLQQLFPITLLLSIGGVELYTYISKQSIPGLRFGKVVQAMISAFLMVVLLLVSTNFHGFDSRQKADEHGIPVESAEVFAALYEIVGDEAIALAASPEMLQYARVYEPAWKPVYGRDLWSGKAASYINSGYDWEWKFYNLLVDDLLPPEECEQLVTLINKEKADCIIVPDFWLETISDMPEYESVRLTDSYIGIMKKDLLAK